MYSSSKTTFIIADDHELYRFGFKKFIEAAHDFNFKIVAEVCNGIDLVKQVEILRPDIVFTDIKMPEMDGIMACTIIKEKFPLTHVIALSFLEEEPFVYQMMNSGASAYLLKANAVEKIVRAIKTVLGGK